MRPVLEIISPGMGMALQDAGRPGWRRFGVAPAGVMDRHAAAAANRLLGNPPGAAVLELLMLGQRLRVLDDTWLALAGAARAGTLEPWSARRFERGEVLEFVPEAAGVWGYLAIPGGFSAPRWFGSVSVDPRNGMGSALRAGDGLFASAGELLVESAPSIGRRVLRDDERRDYARPPALDLLAGPQWAGFPAAAREALVGQTWTVSGQSDRSGYRLEGEALEPAPAILSEPVLPGSLQVPANGLPIVTLNDGPTVGGYPKIAILRDSQRDWMVQCRPGKDVRFRWSH
jgi:biotin-dependent carboxylase-like uncharacterized protein